jgi:hypothetical protein
VAERGWVGEIGLDAWEGGGEIGEGFGGVTHGKVDGGAAAVGFMGCCACYRAAWAKDEDGGWREHCGGVGSWFDCLVDRSYKVRGWGQNSSFGSLYLSVEQTDILRAYQCWTVVDLCQD